MIDALCGYATIRVEQSEKKTCGIFGEAYGKAATIANAIKGFQHSGIHPFDPNRFTEDDFLAADVTNRPPSANDATSSNGETFK